MVDKSYRELLDEVQLTMRNVTCMNNILIERCRVLEAENEELKTTLETTNNLLDEMEYKFGSDNLLEKAYAVIEKKKAEILDLQDTCRRQAKLIRENLGPDNC